MTEAIGAGAEIAQDSPEPDSVMDDASHADSGGPAFTPQEYDAIAAEFDDDEEAEHAEETEEAEEPQGDDEPEPDLDGAADPLKSYIAKLREESADRRVRLKAASDELAYTQDRLERLQRREVETLAAGRMIDPSDIWTRHELADALDDGDVSPDKVGKLIDGLPAHWRRQNARKYTEPVSGATRPGDYRQPSWASAVRNPR